MHTILRTQHLCYQNLQETGCSIYLLRLQQKDQNLYNSFNEKSPYKNSTEVFVQAVLTMKDAHHTLKYV